MSRAADVWQVVLDMPLRRPFDYLAPKENSVTRITPGVRVRVPFGAQRLIGIATRAASESAIAPERLKPILDVLDSAHVLDESLRTLLVWAADYYHHPIGEVFTAALPKALRGGGVALALPKRWIANAAGRAAAQSGAARRAPQQRRILEYLLQNDSGTGAAELTARFPGSAVRALAQRGWIELIDAPPSASVPAPSPTLASGGFDLNPEQRAAVESISGAFGRFAAFLLHGITGSG